ncbi:MAG: zf-HC2 domain-containing protein [Gemmatimonadota bacterium]
MSHLDEGQLAALLDNELTPDEQRVVEAHLAGCAECRALWEETRALATEANRLVATVDLPPAMKPVAGQPGASSGISPAKAAPRPLPLRTLAWAASVLFAVGLGYSLRSVSRGPTDMEAPPAGQERELAERSDKSAAPPAVEQPAAPAVRRDEAPATAGLAAAKPEPTAEAPVASQKTAAPPPSGGVASPQRATSPAATGGVASSEVAGNAALSRRPSEAQDARGFSGLARADTRQVDMEEAVRTLAGSIRLVDGLEPVKVLVVPGSMLLAADPNQEVIRVVYEDPPGRELWLDQQRAAPESDAGRARTTDALLPGDTLLARGNRGSKSVRWIDQHGFLLALTGYLPDDSLRAIIPRVH